MNVLQLKSRAAAVSVASNATLVALKLIVGLAIGSVSVISEAIHSGVDLLAAVIAFVAVRAAGKDADESHPFGHGKFENVSGTVEAGLIFVAAVWIIYEAVHKLHHPRPVEQLGWGVGVMLISSLANTLVSRMLFKVGVATDSVALKADAWHLRTDVYTSGGVMLGLALIVAGGYVFPHTDLQWMDPVAAICVALLIFRAAWGLTRDSARDLFDASLPPDEIQWVRNYVASYEPEVTDCHNLRTRKAGAHRFIHFDVKAPPDTPIREVHALSHRMHAGIVDRFPGAQVTIHFDPQGDPDHQQGPIA
ncbi:MAG TPA: cation diffusion facilitator family transporter [Armatimonadota bacterium]